MESSFRSIHKIKENTKIGRRRVVLVLSLVVVLVLVAAAAYRYTVESSTVKLYFDVFMRRCGRDHM